ncbi:MAG: hypothetical protein IJU76_04185 [Desulfovibrionaceae bacterium]|nr:hypothetical protein [Desulfovibrionaceae bacterium]
MQASYTAYYNAWRTIAWSNPHLSYTGDGHIDNGFCQDCKRCCAPQIGDPPYPMPLLASQCAAGAADALYMMDKETAVLDERGCKALGENGCTLERALRPKSCGLFPIVLMEGWLFLYTLCPASLLVPFMTWFGLAQSVAQWLAALSADDLARLSLAIPDDAINRFTPFHLRIF